MHYEVRLEVNIDVIKRDIEPETVQRVVKAILDKHLGSYIELQSVIVVSPK